MGRDLMLTLAPTVELIRLEEDDSHGTFGVLKINKAVFCVTLEPQDRLNLVNRSSIPAKQYICYRYQSAKYEKTFQVMHVPGRSNILFHAGNVVEDTTGCIILAQHFGKLKGRRAVLNSGKTFENFIRLMEGIGYFHLTIKEMY